MANEPKMKIGIGADTGDFDKGAKKVKQEMKDLSKVSSDAFGAIGAALGVDVNKIQQFTSALQGLSAKLDQAGQAGTSAFGAIGKSVSAVGVGIAGLGLAAAIAAFKQLNAEADAFESTIRGGAIKAQTDAYLSTFRQALRDQSGVGEQAAGFRQTVKMAAATLAGAFESGFDFDRMKEANTLAERAKDIAKDLYDIDLERKEVSVQISELDAQIAQKREVISDTTRSAAERAKALADAQQLIKDKLNLQLPLAEKQRDLLIDYNGLASTKMKDYDAEIAAKINVNNLIQQEAAEQRGLLRQQKQINAELQKQADLQNRVRGGNESFLGPVAERDYAVSIPTQLLTPPAQEFSRFKELVDFQLAGMDFQIGIELDAEKIQQEAQKVADGIKSAMAQGVESMANAVGALLGDLATGQNAWENFANASISAFGEMAISIGKIAIEAGTSVIALNAALSSMSVTGAYAAIAAGAALIILGAAVKTGMSNIAKGNYSASVPSSNYYSSSNLSNFTTKDVEVKVIGTLRADGDSLVAVINNSNRRRGVNT